MRPPLPPFDLQSATEKVQKAENAWNGKDPHSVALAYSENSQWRNRSEMIHGRGEITEFLQRKWAKEIEYRLVKELWAYTNSRIAVRFAYEWRDDSGQWFRSYGNENWEFNEEGLMVKRIASINDLPISKDDRKLIWESDIKPRDYPSLSVLGL